VEKNYPASEGYFECTPDGGAISSCEGLNYEGMKIGIEKDLWSLVGDRLNKQAGGSIVPILAACSWTSLSWAENHAYQAQKVMSP
jgi:hypothetical protein